jgi:hypothetical protein
MSQVIDLTGLPRNAVRQVEKLVEHLRSLNEAEQPRKRLSMKEFDRVLDELGAEVPENPSLPRAFSREDIYLDHD